MRSFCKEKSDNSPKKRKQNFDWPSFTGLGALSRFCGRTFSACLLTTLTICELLQYKNKPCRGQNMDEVVPYQTLETLVCSCLAASPKNIAI